MDDWKYRKTTRLKGADYNGNYAVFLTICTKERKCLLSQIVGTVRPYLLRKWTVQKQN